MTTAQQSPKTGRHAIGAAHPVQPADRRRRRPGDPPAVAGRDGLPVMAAPPPGEMPLAQLAALIGTTPATIGHWCDGFSAVPVPSRHVWLTPPGGRIYRSRLVDVAAARAARAAGGPDIGTEAPAGWLTISDLSRRSGLHRTWTREILARSPHIPTRHVRLKGRRVTLVELAAWEAVLGEIADCNTKDDAIEDRFPIPPQWEAAWTAIRAAKAAKIRRDEPHALTAAEIDAALETVPGYGRKEVA
jgi:hypothetical protein